MDATAAALAKVDEFIAGHDGLTRHGVEQPGQGATNRVVFARRGDQIIVFKVFCEEQRKERECFALRHWRSTGMVPELIWDIDRTMIAMSYVPGDGWFVQARSPKRDQAWAQACRDTGRAIGRLTRVPLSPADRAAFESRFYGDVGTLESYLARILDLGRRIHGRDPDFRDAFWKSTLDFVAINMATILAQPRVLYHQDVSNLHVEGGRFMGFFDLEMCRPGCAAMQLGAALGLVETDHEAWALFRQGWEAGTGAPLTPPDAAVAVAVRVLLGWREISRYLSYDGTRGSGFEWASPAAPVYYRRSFEAVANLLQADVF